MDIPVYLIAIPIVAIIAVIIIAVIGGYLSQKKLDEIVAELGLVEGACYDIVTNDGKNHLNLTYNCIKYGKNSQNGRINIYFTKKTKYRGTLIDREVMIKYGNIWKIARTN